MLRLEQDPSRVFLSLSIALATGYGDWLVTLSDRLLGQQMWGKPEAGKQPAHRQDATTKKASSRWARNHMSQQAA